MTDTEAFAFAESIAAYVRESVAQGMTYDELAGITLRDVMQDLHDSTPGDDLRSKFTLEARILLGSEFA